MRIDPDGRSVQGVTTLLQFVLLNVLYIVACLPVVTAGAATAALYEVTLRYADDERGYLISGYFVALRRNLWRGTAVLALFGLPIAAVVFAAVFWLSAGSVLGTAVGVVAVAIAVHLVAALACALALVARYDAGLVRSCRNALLLPLAEPLRTAWLVLRPLTTIAVLYVAPTTIVIVATIGFSVGAYLHALVLHSIFRRREGREGAAEPVSPHSGE
jgi:uncharacterized membrane protein YesL